MWWVFSISSGRTLAWRLDEGPAARLAGGAATLASGWAQAAQLLSAANRLFLFFETWRSVPQFSLDSKAAMFCFEGSALSLHLIPLTTTMLFCLRNPPLNPLNGKVSHSSRIVVEVVANLSRRHNAFLSSTQSTGTAVSSSSRRSHSFALRQRRSSLANVRWLGFMVSFMAWVRQLPLRQPYAR